MLVQELLEPCVRRSSPPVAGGRDSGGRVVERDPGLSIRTVGDTLQRTRDALPLTHAPMLAPGSGLGVENRRHPFDQPVALFGGSGSTPQEALYAVTSGRECRVELCLRLNAFRDDACAQTVGEV